MPMLFFLLKICPYVCFFLLHHIFWQAISISAQAGFDVFPFHYVSVVWIQEDSDHFHSALFMEIICSYLMIEDSSGCPFSCFDFAVPPCPPQERHPLQPGLQGHAVLPAQPAPWPMSCSALETCVHARAHPMALLCSPSAESAGQEIICSLCGSLLPASLQWHFGGRTLVSFVLDEKHQTHVAQSISWSLGS